MSRCNQCGREIESGSHCPACQSKSLFLDQGAGLPDCFDWEVPPLAPITAQAQLAKP